MFLCSPLPPVSLSLEELAVFFLGTYYSKCGPWTRSISLTWQLDKNSNSQASELEFSLSKVMFLKIQETLL